MSSEESSPFDANGPRNDSEKNLSLVLDLGSMWVRERQKGAMLGAFAIGVFAGAWLRE